jgi:secretion/DNA translocation related CpaE-like protein
MVSPPGRDAVPGHGGAVGSTAAQETTVAVRNVIAPAPFPPKRPLVVTSDPGLLDDLLRVAGDTGVTVDVAPDPAAARRWYGPAPLVLVGVDSAPHCARAHLPRRRGVVLVGYHDGPQPPDWPVADQLGADHIIGLPAAEPWLAGQLTHARRLATAGGRIVVVLGGRGGAGASVLAAGLAVTAANTGLRTLLIDADPLGGGLDMLLGWETVTGLRWPELTDTSGRVDPPSLVESLPGRGDLAVLSWDRGDVLAVPVEAMATALDAGRRGRDLVVVDLSRRLDEAAMLALGAADRGYLVVPAELRACAAAARVAAVAAPHCPSLSVVVRSPAPGGLSAADVAKSLGLPLYGHLRAETNLPVALERGNAPGEAPEGSLAKFCRRLLRDIKLDPAPRGTAA